MSTGCSVHKLPCMHASLCMYLGARVHVYMCMQVHMHAFEQQLCYQWLIFGPYKFILTRTLTIIASIKSLSSFMVPTTLWVGFLQRK